MGVQTINILRDRPDWDAMKTYLHDLGATVVLREEELVSHEGRTALKQQLPQAPILALNGVGGASATELARTLGYVA